MWAGYLRNVQRAIRQGRLRTNEQIADFIANEYDKTVKKGGDLIYKVNVINGNKEAMASSLKSILDKNSNKQGENINLLEDLPKVFDAYWVGAEYSPIPNPLLKPQGWSGTTSVDTPQCVILGPDFNKVAISASKNKIQKELLKKLVDELKKQTTDIKFSKDFLKSYSEKVGQILPESVSINVYDATIALLKNQNPIPNTKKEVQDFVNNNRTIKLAKKLLKKYNEARKKKPSGGSQHKKGAKFKFPALVNIKKLLKEQTKKLEEEFTQKVNDKIKELVEELVVLSIVDQLELIIKSYKEQVPKLPTKQKIKKYVEGIKNDVKDIKDDLIPFKIEGIPNKDTFKDLIQKSIPDTASVQKVVKDVVKNLIPKIPYIEIVKPNPYLIDMNKIVWGKPFVREAKRYMFNVEGTVQVLSQCGGPTSPPNPLILRVKGYQIKNGPPVPPIPSGIKEPDIKLPPLPDKLPEQPDLNKTVTQLIKVPTIPITISIDKSIPKIGV